jgi:hypothetical protein
MWRIYSNPDTHGFMTNGDFAFVSIRAANLGFCPTLSAFGQGGIILHATLRLFCNFTLEGQLIYSRRLQQARPTGGLFFSGSPWLHFLVNRVRMSSVFLPCCKRRLDGLSDENAYISPPSSKAICAQFCSLSPAMWIILKREVKQQTTNQSNTHS